MSKPRRMYETKTDRSRRLPNGTWFVWPDTLPRRYTYYQPRVYRALGDGKTSEPVYADIGVWDHTDGIHSPAAAYGRCNEVAQQLNARNASETAAKAYVQKQSDRRLLEASEKLGRLLQEPSEGYDK